MANVKGIDVSEIQGNIDWKTVKASGIDFVVVKNFQGNDGQDSMVHKNLSGAKAAGIETTIYNFPYPLPTDPAHPNRDPIDQARLHFNSLNTEEVVCVDCEWPATQDWKAWGIDAAFIRRWLLTYLQEFERLSGKKPVLYTYPYWAEAVEFTEEFAGYQLWIASYEPTPTIPKPWTDWVMWQTTDGGMKLPSGAPVDTDVAKDLSLWNAAPTTVVEPSLPPITQPTPPVQSDLSQVIVAPYTAIVSSQNAWGSILSFLEHLFK